jgi:hypothetical protein
VNELSEQPRRVILGSGRSGTTWVLDCLALSNDLRPIFEPLHPKESKIGEEYAYQVMAASDTAKDLEIYFDGLAAGRIHSRWIDLRVPKGLLRPNPTKLVSREFAGRWIHGWQKHLRDRKKLSERAKKEAALIKCIRANLMAGWLCQSLKFRTAFIVRHPCAAIESQVRAGAVWDPSRVLEKYSQDTKLRELTGGRYEELLRSKLSNIQALTLRWIIENQWPIEQAADDGYFVISYEELVNDPESAWKALCKSLDLTRTPDPESLRKPSQQASGVYIDEHVNKSGVGEPRWRQGLDKSQLREIQGILDVTGFCLYNIGSENPTERLGTDGNAHSAHIDKFG